MRFRGVLLQMSCLLLAAECINIRPVEFGRLNILAYDGAGGRVPVQRAELRSISTNELLHSTSSGDLPSVTEGDYRLRVHVNGFAATESIVHVAPGTTQTRVQMRLGIECGSRVTLRGKVSPISGRKDRWLKITPLHGPGGTDTPIQPDGFFHVEGLDSGDHLLIVTEDGKPRHMQVVNLRGVNVPDAINLKLPPG